ncbi:hypothetical protein AGMMS50268_02520 [Spirochaetia bacterium]|nr:hypothetical protein AGMMS50268_02520 [Spirochaetia bacterium]
MDNKLKQTILALLPQVKKMSALQKKALFMLCVFAGSSFMALYTAACQMEATPAKEPEKETPTPTPVPEPVPEFDTITLTGTNAWAAPYINLKKTHGLAVGDAMFDKMLTGFANFLSISSCQIYANAHPLDITITASDNNAANGRISIAFIDANSTASISYYFDDYKDAHVFARAKGGLQLALDQAQFNQGVFLKKIKDATTLSKLLGTRDSIAMFQNGLTSLTGQRNAKAM